MPIGKYPDFASCVSDQKSKGKDDNSAKKICGFLEKQSKGAEVQEKDGHLYLKAFLLDSSVNLNEWGVSQETLDQNINTYIGKPLVVQEDFGHPESADPNYDHHLQYQERFRIGNIIDIVKKDSIYSAIIEVTDNQAKEAFRSGNLPLYVSPQIYHDGVGKEPDNAALTWRGTHLAVVREPAFGIKKARITGQCNGGSECLAQLKKASCNFCIKKTIDNYKVSNNENKISSLRKNRLNNSSKLSEQTVEVKTYSEEEYNKLKTANDELSIQLKEKNDALKLKDDVAASLKQSNEELTERVSNIEKQARTEKIANILSAVSFKTDEERQKKLDTLVDSNLKIDFIKETFEPMAVKSASVHETKLPQKSASVEKEEPYFVKLQKFYGGSN